MPEDPKRLPFDAVHYPKLLGAGEVDIDADVYINESREGRGKIYLQGGINAALDKAHDEAGFASDYSHPTDKVRLTFVIRAELYDA